MEKNDEVFSPGFFEKILSRKCLIQVCCKMHGCLLMVFFQNRIQKTHGRHVTVFIFYLLVCLFFINLITVYLCVFLTKELKASCIKKKELKASCINFFLKGAESFLHQKE